MKKPKQSNKKKGIDKLDTSVIAMGLPLWQYPFSVYMFADLGIGEAKIAFGHHCPFAIFHKPIWVFVGIVWDKKDCCRYRNVVEIALD